MKHIYNSTKQLGDHDKFILLDQIIISCSLTATRIFSQRSCLSSAMPQRKVMLPKSGSHLGFQNEKKPMMEPLFIGVSPVFLMSKK